MEFSDRQPICKACGTVGTGKCSNNLECSGNLCSSCRKIAARANVEIEYCERTHITNAGTADNMNMDVTKLISPPPTPHLDVTCKICGYIWLEKCDDIEAGEESD